MKTGLRWLWPAFVVFSVALVGGAAWISVYLLAQEERARYEQDLRLALRRVDHEASLLLAREAERPFEVYDPYYFLREDAYTRGYARIQDNEILTRSPLLTFTPDYVRLHFQLGADGSVSSPQVPTGNFRDIAEERGVPMEGFQDRARTLDRIREIVGLEELRKRLRRAEEISARFEGETNEAWLQQRAQSSKRSRAPARTTPAVNVGALEAIWLRGELFFVRRVQVRDDVFLQGFLTDWPRLRSTLLDQVTDLFPDARLEPAVGSGVDRRLFTLPAVLEASPTDHGWSPGHTILLTAWSVIAPVLLLLAFLVHTSLKRARQQKVFASMVSHELRSPLTTIRLYAELLDEQMVEDPQKRADQIHIMRLEADQMARMLENVLLHTRVETGRSMPLERIDLGELLDEIRPDLEQCVERQELTMALDAGGVQDLPVRVEVKAVGQILHNLVENACRYGRSERVPAILVGAGVREREVLVRVRDYGPGVPAAVRRRIFRTYERGGRGRTEKIRGFGLGLAISRGLAREMGGRLTLETPPDGGACFVLRLPVAT